MLRKKAGGAPPNQKHKLDNKMTTRKRVHVNISDVTTPVGETKIPKEWKKQKKLDPPPDQTILNNSSVLVYPYTGMPLYWWSGIQVDWYTGILVYQYTLLGQE